MDVNIFLSNPFCFPHLVHSFLSWKNFFSYVSAVGTAKSTSLGNLREVLLFSFFFFPPRLFYLCSVLQCGSSCNTWSNSTSLRTQTVSEGREMLPQRQIPIKLCSLHTRVNPDTPTPFLSCECKLFALKCHCDLLKNTWFFIPLDTSILYFLAILEPLSFYRTAQQLTDSPFPCGSVHRVHKHFHRYYSRTIQAVNVKCILDITERLHQC